MLNQVQIIGRLGRSPELKYTQSGNPVCTLNIATDESYTDQKGNKVERTEWHRVVLFNKQAENAAQYLDKGSLVYISGKLSTRKWEDQNGQDHFTTEILANTIKYLSRSENGTQKPAQSAKQSQDDYPEPSEMDGCPF